MCDGGKHALIGVSHWGKGKPSVCPKGGTHGPRTTPGSTVIDKPGVVGYLHIMCTACGLEGTCTD